MKVAIIRRYPLHSGHRKYGETKITADLVSYGHLGTYLGGIRSLFPCFYSLQLAFVSAAFVSAYEDKKWGSLSRSGPLEFPARYRAR